MVNKLVLQFQTCPENEESISDSQNGNFITSNVAIMCFMPMNNIKVSCKNIEFALLGPNYNQE